MADFSAPSQPSKFCSHRHGKLVNPQKKLSGRFAHLVDVASMAEHVNVQIHSNYATDGQPVASNSTGAMRGSNSFSNNDKASVASSGTNNNNTTSMQFNQINSVLSTGAEVTFQDSNTTEEQREAYLFYHHYAHLIFMVYRLYVRSFVMPSSVSQNELPLVDITSLLAVPAAVGTTMSSAASAVSPATILEKGPSAVINRLTGDAQIRQIASTVPCFLALSPCFYTHTGVSGMGTVAPPASANNGPQPSRVMTPLEALNAAAVLKQIVLALATDFATLLPFGQPAGSPPPTTAPKAPSSSPSSSASLTNLLEVIAPFPSVASLLLRHQLLLAVIFEVQQLTQPTNDFAVRRIGFELLVRIYTFRMAGCVVPSRLAARKALVRASGGGGGGSSASAVSMAAFSLENNSDAIDLGGGDDAAVMLGTNNTNTAPSADGQPSSTAGASSDATVRANAAVASAERLLRESTFDGSGRGVRGGEADAVVDADGSPLPPASNAFLSSFAALSSDERLLLALIDWDYFTDSYANGAVTIPALITTPPRSAVTPDTSRAISSGIAGSDSCPAMMPFRYHDCFPLNPLAPQRSIEICMNTEGTTTSAATSALKTMGLLSAPPPEQPRADRGREATAMLNLLIEMPVKAGFWARRAVMPSTFPYTVVPGPNGTTTSSYTQIKTPAYKRTMLAVHASVRERWWAMLKRTVVRLFAPSAFFEATFHHEERLAGRSSGGGGIVGNASFVTPPNASVAAAFEEVVADPTSTKQIPFYKEGFRNGHHALVHPLLLDTVCHVYYNGRAELPTSSFSSAAANGAPLLGTTSSATNQQFLDLAITARRAPSVIHLLQSCRDVCEDATEPFPASLPTTLAALTRNLGQDLRLIALLSLSTISDGGASPSGDVNDVSTPIPCPPRTVIKAQGMLVDMLRKPHAAVIYPATASPSAPPRIFPLSDYIGVFIEGSLLTLATPTVTRHRTAFDVFAERGLVVVSQEQQSAASVVSQSFLYGSLQQAAAYGLAPRAILNAEIAKDALSRLGGGGGGAQHDAAVIAQLTNPSVSTLYNYRAYYYDGHRNTTSGSGAATSRTVRGVPSAALHYLVPMRIGHAIGGSGNSVLGGSKSAAAGGSAAVGASSPLAPMAFSAADACAQIESLAELLYVVCTCDSACPSAITSGSVNGNSSALLSSALSSSYARLVTTRVKHAAVNALTAVVCELTLLSVEGGPTVRATLADSLAFSNECLWSSCAAAVDRRGAEKKGGVVAGAGKAIEESPSSSAPHLSISSAGFVCAPHDPSTFSKIVIPFMTSVLEPALMSTSVSLAPQPHQPSQGQGAAAAGQQGKATFGGLRPCDDTCHNTMGSTMAVPRVFETWGSLVQAMLSNCWGITSSDRSAKALFSYGSSSSSSSSSLSAPTSLLASGGANALSLLYAYRDRRAAVPMDDVYGYIQHCQKGWRTAYYTNQPVAVDEGYREEDYDSDDESPSSANAAVLVDNDSLGILPLSAQLTQASDAKGDGKKKKRRDPYRFRVAHSMLSLFFSTFSTDALVVKQLKGTVLCALSNTLAARRRAATGNLAQQAQNNVDANEVCSLEDVPNGTTLLAELLPYLGLVCGLKGSSASSLAGGAVVATSTVSPPLPIAVEAASRIAELIALPPSSPTDTSESATAPSSPQSAEQFKLLYASAVAHLRGVLPLPHSLMRYVEANVKAACSSSGGGANSLAATEEERKKAAGGKSQQPAIPSALGFASNGNGPLNWVSAIDMSDATALLKEKLNTVNSASSPSKSKGGDQSSNANAASPLSSSASTSLSASATLSSQQDPTAGGDGGANSSSAGGDLAHSMAPHIFAAGLATAIARAITPRTDTEDPSGANGSALINSGAGLSDNDINAIVLGQRVIQQLCRPNTLQTAGKSVGHLGVPTSSLLSMDLSPEMAASSTTAHHCSVRAPLMPLLLDVASITLLLAPITKFYDVTADVADEGFRNESTYVYGPSYAHPRQVLVAKAGGGGYSPAVVTAKVTGGGCRLAKRALALFHDLNNKKVSSLMVIDWAISDLMTSSTTMLPDGRTESGATNGSSSPSRSISFINSLLSSPTPTAPLSPYPANRHMLYKIIAVLEASLHSSGPGGAEFPTAHLARVLAKLAALVLTPTTAKESFPIDFTLAHRVINVIMMLWSDPAVLRKDLRFVGVIASTVEVVSNGLIALFKLQCVTRYEGVRRMVEGLYSHFVTSLSATIFFYNHDSTWGVSPSVLQGGGGVGGTINDGPSSSAAPSSPSSSVAGLSAVSKAMKRFSMARQSVASSASSAALVECSSALLLTLTRLTESVQHLGLHATVFVGPTATAASNTAGSLSPAAAAAASPASPTTVFPHVTLRQLLVDVVHLLHHGRTSIDYWVKAVDTGLTVGLSQHVPIRSRPIVLVAHALPKGTALMVLEGSAVPAADGTVLSSTAQEQQQQAAAAAALSDEEQLLLESAEAVSSTLLDHLSQLDLPQQQQQQMDASAFHNAAKFIGEEVMRIADAKVGKPQTPSKAKAAVQSSARSDAASSATTTTTVAQPWLYVGAAKHTIARKVIVPSAVPSSLEGVASSSSSTAPAASVTALSATADGGVSPNRRSKEDTSSPYGRCLAAARSVVQEAWVALSSGGEAGNAANNSSGASKTVALKDGAVIRLCSSDGPSASSLNKESLLLVFQEAELLLAELAAATVRASAKMGGEASAAEAEDSTASSCAAVALVAAGADDTMGFLGVPMISVAGRPSVLCPWVHLASAPNFQSYLIQRLQAEDRATSSASVLSRFGDDATTRSSRGKPIHVALQRLHAMVDTVAEAAMGDFVATIGGASSPHPPLPSAADAADDLDIPLPPPTQPQLVVKAANPITFSTALCRGTLALHYAASLLQRSLEVRGGGQLVPVSSYLKGMASTASSSSSPAAPAPFIILKGDASSPADATCFIGREENPSGVDSLRFVSATGRGATAFSITAPRGRKGGEKASLSAVAVTAAPSSQPIIALPTPKISSTLDDILSDFNKGIFVPRMKPSTPMCDALPNSSGDTTGVPMITVDSADDDLGSPSAAICDMVEEEMNSKLEVLIENRRTRSLFGNSSGGAFESHSSQSNFAGSDALADPSAPLSSSFVNAERLKQAAATAVGMTTPPTTSGFGDGNQTAVVGGDSRTPNLHSTMGLGMTVSLCLDAMPGEESFCGGAAGGEAAGGEAAAAGGGGGGIGNGSDLVNLDQSIVLLRQASVHHLTAASSSAVRRASNASQTNTSTIPPSPSKTDAAKKGGEEAAGASNEVSSDQYAADLAARKASFLHFVPVKQGPYTIKASHVDAVSVYDRNLAFDFVSNVLSPHVYGSEIGGSDYSTRYGHAMLGTPSVASQPLPMTVPMPQLNSSDESNNNGAANTTPNPFATPLCQQQAVLIVNGSTAKAGSEARRAAETLSAIVASSLSDVEEEKRRGNTSNTVTNGTVTTATALNGLMTTVHTITVDASSEGACEDGARIRADAVESIIAKAIATYAPYSNFCASPPPQPQNGTVPAPIIVVIVDGFSPMVEALNRRFATATPAATVLFMQPLCEGQPKVVPAPTPANPYGPAIVSGPTSVLLHVLRAGLGSHMAPLQDAVLIPLTASSSSSSSSSSPSPPPPVSSPLAHLLKALVNGAASRSTPTQYLIGGGPLLSSSSASLSSSSLRNGYGGGGGAVRYQATANRVVPIEFTQAFPSSLRVAVASDLHLMCVVEGLTH